MVDASLIVVYVGEILVGIGVLCDLIGAIGMLRFPNFYLRLHAATVGTIGGAFIPLIGVALMAIGSTYLGMYRWFVAGGAIVTAFLYSYWPQPDHMHLPELLIMPK